MWSAVGGALLAAGPWAIAVGSWGFVAWLVVSGKFIPQARHREVIALYEKMAERDAAALAARDAQVAELMSHSRLAAQTWESLRREAEAA